MFVIPQLNWVCLGLQDGLDSLIYSMNCQGNRIYFRLFKGLERRDWENDGGVLLSCSECNRSRKSESAAQ